MKLNTQPTGFVAINVVSSDTTQGTVFPTSLTFTSSNWNTSQTVTVTRVGSSVADYYTIQLTLNTGSTTDSSGYAALEPPDVTVINTADPTAGFTLSGIFGNTAEDGTTATFTVKLTSVPASDVVLNVVSSDTTEGTVSPAALTFTPSNWNTSQTVTMTGVNDDLADGPQSYTAQLTVKTGTGGTVSANIYAILKPEDVRVINTDDETAGFTVSTLSGNTDEAGGTAAFTVELTSQPTGNVMLDVASSDTTEGTVSPATLTFTSANWNTSQTVTVTGIEDDIIDGDQNYALQLTVNSGGTTDTSGYAALKPDYVPVTNSGLLPAARVAFTDTDPDTGEIGGVVTITKAGNESEVTHYVLYWGSNATTKLSGYEALSSIAKTGSDLTYSFNENTSIPSGVNYLLVFTRNDAGEMTTGVSIGFNSTFDNVTGLWWQDNGYTSTHNWNNAISYCDNLDLDGYSDWRLPSSDELAGLYARRNILRSFASSNYWSSTTGASYTGDAWHVDFYNGHVYNYYKTNTYCVRCVRGG
ncbi:DUF1566 domain-containing protein [Deltaproteobacteria bacterium TL4]